MALRRARHRERPARLEIAAAVVDPAHLLGVREQSRFLVDDQGVVLPRVPVTQDHLEELVGAIIALIVLRHGVAAHVAGLGIIEGGDDVPGGATAGQRIESGKLAGDMERLVVGGRVGDAEAQPLGRHADRGHAGEGVHLHAANAVGDGLLVVAGLELGHREAVVEKCEVKLAGFQRPADVAIKVGRHEVRAAVGVSP